ncbi:low-density lipoprotein receptor-related protein 2-like [Octopus sinensis]|uniref:Low-density lipoprotein receptor-related protein 2-like n=1 Tax=Octopus sinensis TaxID=2607531 RepID=A0A7E6F343_9MOLL|nr:low-density lipoprotein receptor-related protein 2-like [Octopus sinensis]
MAIDSSIHSISLHPNRTRQKITTIAATDEVSSVGYDAKSNQIYYGINNPAAIVRYDGETKTSQQFVIDPENKQAFIGKIAVDWTGQKIYWTDALYNRISVMSFDSTYKATLLTTQKPRSIVLDPCKGYMYWSNSGIGQSPSIEKSTMAGNQRSVLVSSDLGDPDGLAIDYTYEKLYWADTLKNQIERISLDGRYRDVIVTTTYEPTSITVFGLHIYWISSFRKLVYRAEKHTGANSIRMTKFLTSSPADIVVFSADLQSCKRDPCQKFNGGCSQGCHPAPNGEAECSCNGTSQVVSKYKACVPENHNCSDTEFICSNGKCIFKSWVCDEDDDCRDGSDENSNLCATHTCEKTQYRCNNGRCINHLFRCDFDDDCRDNSDEIGCDASTCGPAQFTCKNSRCIDAAQVCDGYDQCRDGEQTDEKNCPNNMTCPENKVKCPNSNICVRINLLCDGDDDCGDNSDENAMFCKAANCTGHFRCLQANRCIPSHWYCDGAEDCSTGEDEPTNCHVNLTCASHMFACGSGGCIYKAWMCDGENDCSDGSDEAIDCRNIACAADEFNCTHNRNIGIYPCIKKTFVCDGDKNCADGEDERQSCPPDVCDDNEFACANGGCILSKFVCDREDDCGDRSDEHDNCEYPECGADLFTCDNHRCILNSWVCDGDNDCRDNSDEKESVCLTPAPTCPPGQFRCDNGECINYLLACNKNPDCSDQTDERHCYINECEDVVVHRCEHTCIDTLTSYHCECNPGYTLMTDRKACRDIDECLEKPDTCSQMCHNTVGNYSCKCNEGYMRGLDTHSCKKKDDEIPWLVFGNRHYIRKMTLDGLTYQLIAQGLRELISLDFDYQEQKLYFFDKWTLDIQTIFLNGSDQKVLFHQMQFGQCTLAVDWVGRKLYTFWLYIRALFVSELNGTSLRTLDTHLFYHVSFLVAYPPTGYLYFIDIPSKAWIGRIGMDGSNYERLIIDGLGLPTGLTIDFESQRMWWADAHFDAIEYANLDGTHRQTVMKENVPFIHSLAVFEDWIYWTDSSRLSIEKAHKFTGRNHTILRNMTHQPSILIVFHSLRQKQYKNPCGSNNGGCSHLCLHSPPDDYVCACPDHFLLDADNKTCIANCSTSQFRCGKGDDRCIPFFYRCDKDVDCHDGSDELNCPETKCGRHTFTCNNGNCTRFYKICDSKDDCGDGSDEDRCGANYCSPWSFRCNNNRCVYRSWQCDGYNDCLDNSDEDQALCIHRSCGVHEFTCDNGYCIPEHDKCDYENDCFDGSDESLELNCANQTCPATSFRCETNYRCIPSTYVCDGYDNCGDNSDEKLSNCKKCNETKEFKCKNNVCIPKTWVCDSKTDCRDGSDEDTSFCKNKYRDCTESEFRCENQRCVLKKWRCNLYDDCGDGSDENNCASVKCSEDEFKCDTGHCIKKYLTCDGWRNCRDASDERNCTPKYGDRYCPIDRFQCNNTVCIPKQWMCDSDDDCGDKSDETREVCLQIECSKKERRFRCNNLLCIPIWRVCNGRDNCGDGSDENTHHLCEPKEEICEQDQFKCTSKECIDSFKVCNEIADCADKSDEIGCIKNAGAVNCSIDNGGCPHNCTDLEGGGMICSCRSGFKMKDGKTKECMDVNECELSNNKCPQLCNNIKGSYKCLCHEGFQDPLLPTPKCKYTKEGKISIFMSVGSGIRRFDPIIKEYMSTLLSIQKSQGLAVDIERSTLYWTDMISKTVMRSYISQKSDNVGIPQDLKISNLDEPNGISIDWTSGNVYWTDSKKKTISVAAKDGRYRYTLIKTELRRPYAIVVNSQTGWMYWTDINSYNPR